MHTLSLSTPLEPLSFKVTPNEPMIPKDQAIYSLHYDEVQTQSAVRLTQYLVVLGSMPGPATYFRFSFRSFKKGSESMGTKYWLTP